MKYDFNRFFKKTVQHLTEEHETKMQRAEDVHKMFGAKEEFEKKMSGLINGQMIMDQLPDIKGPIIGQIKDKVRDWIIQNQFKVTPEEVNSKIQEYSTMKESKFNKLVNKIVESNTAGGAASVFGDVSSTETHFSGDNYATGDSRLPKALGKGVMRRTMPELTVFANGVIKNKKKRTKKKKNAK